MARSLVLGWTAQNTCLQLETERTTDVTSLWNVNLECVDTVKSQSRTASSALCCDLGQVRAETSCISCALTSVIVVG